MELPDGPLKAMYDDEHRDQIRRELIEYSTQHRIGTPTLQLRIAQASDRTLDEVNNKTLQRFLAGKHRTNDAFVWLCHKFLLGIDVADPVKNFGDAAATFFQHNPDLDALSDAKGEYQLSAYMDVEDQEEFRHSRLILVPVKDRSYLRAVEEVSNVFYGGAHIKQFEGVAFIRPKGLSVVSRDSLTRRQKWLLIFPERPSSEFDFRGEMMTPLFFGSSEGVNSIYRVRGIKLKGDN